MSDMPQLTIKTPRLLLRPIKQEDAEQMLDFLSLPEVMRYTTRLPMTEVSQASLWLSARSTGPQIFNFTVTLPPSDDGLEAERIIGILGSHNFPTLGYIFHSAYGKQGYATEALTAFLPHYFERLPRPTVGTDGDMVVGEEGWDFVVAHVDCENVNSIRLLERVGFTRGERKERAYVSGMLGERADVTFRMARPGLKLEDVFGRMKEIDEEEPPVPDMQ